MAWSVSNRRGVRRGTSAENAVGAAVRWPRGLGTAGLVTMLVSAWGALVPFLGPAIGYHANNSPSWNWSSEHAWLYVLPGVVGFIMSVGVIGRSRGGRAWTRVSLAALGLILVACGAWFVLGPSAWAVVSSGGAFSTTQSAIDTFTAMVGYNLGVGLVIAIGGGIVISASLGEREVVVLPATATPSQEPVAADSAYQARTDRPVQDPVDPAASSDLPAYSPSEREL